MKISFRYRPICAYGPFCFFQTFLILICLVFPGRAQSLPDWPENWSTIGRAQIQTTPASIIIAGGYAVNRNILGDGEIAFRARAPLSANEVQIWAGFRYRDRESGYVFALRGGNDDDIYLARYAPNGGAEFLGFAPLDFKPEPGVWYRLRVVFCGKRIQIFLNDEKLPRLNVVDPQSLWNTGNAFLGGGWLPAEFADLQIEPLSDKEKTNFRHIGDQRWSAPPIEKAVAAPLAIRQRNGQPIHRQQLPLSNRSGQRFH